MAPAMDFEQNFEACNIALPCPLLALTCIKPPTDRHDLHFDFECFMERRFRESNGNIKPVKKHDSDEIDPILDLGRLLFYVCSKDLSPSSAIGPGRTISNPARHLRRNQKAPQTSGKARFRLGSPAERERLPMRQSKPSPQARPPIDFRLSRLSALRRSFAQVLA